MARRCGNAASRGVSSAPLRMDGLGRRTGEWMRLLIASLAVWSVPATGKVIDVTAFGARPDDGRDDTRALPFFSRQECMC